MKKKFSFKRLVVSSFALSLALGGTLNYIAPVQVINAVAVDVTCDRYTFKADTGTLTLLTNEGATNGSMQSGKWQATIDGADVKHIVIGDNVTEIGENGIIGCYNLESITYGENLKVIKSGSIMFYPLETLILPDSLETVESSAIEEAKRLKTIIFGNNVTSLGNYSLRVNDILESVKMSSRIESLGSQIVKPTSNLVIKMTGETPPTIESDTFPSDIKITVPKGTLATYKAAPNWSSVTATIEEGDYIAEYSGTTSGTPVLDNVKGTVVTLKSIEIANETVEYAVSENANPSTLVWQDSEKFENLKEDTSYYFFARVKETGMHSADITSKALNVATPKLTDEIRLELVKPLAEAAINEYIVTNETIANNLLDNVKEAIKTVAGVDAIWSEAAIVDKATTEKEGSLKGTIQLSLNDAKLDIEVNKTIAKLKKEYTYEVTSEKNVIWNTTSDTDIIITIDGDYNLFNGVKIDGTKLANENYTVKKGSTILTLNNDYLKSLSVGRHAATIIFDGKEVTYEFTVSKSDSKPTPDEPTKPDNKPTPDEPSKPADKPSQIEPTTPEGTPTTPADKETAKSPNTSDTTKFMTSLIALLASGGLITVLHNRKKEAK